MVATGRASRDELRSAIPVEPACRHRERPPLPAMPLTLALCLTLVVATTVVHFEMLKLLSERLAASTMAPRRKLVAVVLGTFVAHATEIALYAAAIWACIALAGVGGLSGSGASLFTSSLYFSAETYTSLGFGDLVPTGPLRLVAGVETLNGLLLIGWSASFTYLAMERFWDPKPEPAA